jgi:hypothetical protein
MVSFASNVVITAEGPCVQMRSWDLNQDQMSSRDAYLLRRKFEDRDKRVRPH